MGTSKTALFSEDHNALAATLKALAHPARIAILEYLVKVDTCICGDIVNELPLAQPTVSQHLRELKNAGLIKGNVEGTAICYCVEKSAVSRLADYFEAMAVKLDNKEQECC